MSLDLVTVIIRSVGERTESLCKKLILEQGVAEEAVFTIKEAPFSKAMRVGFEIAIAKKRPWTYCVDADILLRQGAISTMVNHAESQPKNVCEIQGFVLDKFFGGSRMAGNHLYRTSLLNKVIDCIPPEGKDIRPETHTLNTMRAVGYPWHSINELVGLHDFEQSYEDIFRKCFVHAHKHLSYVELFIPFWRAKSSDDSDYKISLLGFAEGIKHHGEVRIDTREEYFRNAIQSLNDLKKNDLDLEQWSLDDVESKIRCWTEPEAYWKKFPIGMRGHNTSLVSRVADLYRQHRSQTSAKESGLRVLSWLLIALGNKLAKDSL